MPPRPPRFPALLATVHQPSSTTASSDMSTWATAAPPLKRIARRPRKNAAITPRERTRKERKRSILPFLPYEILDLIGRYLFDAPSSVPDAPFPSSYHVRDRYPDDTVSWKIDRHHTRELARPTGLREIMALARTCKSLNNFFGPWTSEFGGISSPKHLPALEKRIREVKYLYINNLDGSRAELDKLFGMLLPTDDVPLQIQEIVVKKCGHSSEKGSINWWSPDGSWVRELSLPKCQSFTVGKEVCAGCGPEILLLFINRGMPNLSHLRIALPLAKLDGSTRDYRFHRGTPRRRPRPQTESLEDLLRCVSRRASSIKTLHLETRCERKAWGGLVQTGFSSNDPEPRNLKTDNKLNSDPCSPEESIGATIADSETDTESDESHDESGDEDRGEGDSSESATVDGTPTSRMSPSALASTTPAPEGVGNGQGRAARRLADLGLLQRHTMLSDHQNINRQIAANFKSLEELRVYRAGVARLEIMKEDDDLSSYIDAFVTPFASSSIKSVDFSMVISTHLANRLGRLERSLPQDAFAEKCKEAKADLEAWRDTVMRSFIMGEAPAAPKPVATVVKIAPPQEVEPKTEQATSASDKAVEEHPHPHTVVRPKPVPVGRPAVLPSLTREQLEAATQKILNGITALPAKPAAALAQARRRPGLPPATPPPQVTALKPTAAKTLDSWPGTAVHGRFYLPNMDPKVRPKACLHVFEWTAPTLTDEPKNDDNHEYLDNEAKRLRDELARADASTVSIKPVKLVRFA